MQNTASIWVLADDRAGNVSQCLGVAEALNLPFEVKHIRYNGWVRLPNALRGASLLGTDTTQSTLLAAPWPVLVIAAGRRVAPVARYIKRQSGGKSKLVQLMWPGFPSKDFDLIALPSHDKQRKGSNITYTTGSPSRITPQLLQEAAGTWQPHFTHLPRPLIALIVGGSTKHHRFTPAHAEALGKQASDLAQKSGGALLITTSRRTGTEPAEALLKAITCPYYLHDWKQGGENPYFGYLACADSLVVTGDSMSMCSEAMATGKPTYIFAPADATSAKHARLHRELYNENYAKPLHNPSGTWDALENPPAAFLAEMLKQRYFPR